MTAALLIALAAKSAVVGGVTLLLLQALKGRSAAERSWVAHAGLTVLLLLPVGALTLPSWRVAGLAHQAPPPVLTASSGAVTLPAASASAAGLPAAPIDFGMLLQGLYMLGAGVLFLAITVGVIRLFALRGRAAVLVDAAWLTALARAQRRMGVKSGAALLVSDEINSPLSWGMLRPTILLNEKVVPLHGDAEAIIAHELAHVVRFDWVKLLLARAVTALYWFNPLVWILARQCHQLREEAADDAVLRSDVPCEDYAALLVGAARHDCKAALFAAHGVAPSRSSLRQRVTRVLDQSPRRVPTAAAWAACCLAGASLLGGPLAALTLEAQPSEKSQDAVSRATKTPETTTIGPEKPLTAGGARPSDTAPTARAAPSRALASRPHPDALNPASVVQNEVHARAADGLASTTPAPSPPAGFYRYASRDRHLALLVDTRRSQWTLAFESDPDVTKGIDIGGAHDCSNDRYLCLDVERIAILTVPRYGPLPETWTWRGLTFRRIRQMPGANQTWWIEASDEGRSFAHFSYSRARGIETLYLHDGAEPPMTFDLRRPGRGLL